MAQFQLGVNYWPHSSAMAMWSRFDPGEIGEDFARIAGLGLRVVRFFLTWETFQPQPYEIDGTALRRLDAVLEAARAHGLQTMPTLFTGHMSGVNWLPEWTLDRSRPVGRFRTISGGRDVPAGAGDLYRGPLLDAQRYFARALGARYREHAAIAAWDLGNEFSNLREPSSPQAAAAWSAALTSDLHETSGLPVTGGIHGEDLTFDRNIRPSSICAPWDLATMHGYSVYSTFARGRLDALAVPFLASLTSAFARKPLVFSEFGNPSCPPPGAPPLGFDCLDEGEMAAYAQAVLEGLHSGGALGAYWWCWADYAETLAAEPPFDRAPHELRFGITRADGTLKPVAETLSTFAREGRETVAPSDAAETTEDTYYAELPESTARTYAAYCAAHGEVRA